VRDEFEPDEAVVWYGERLAQRRRLARISQASLAAGAGVSQSTISRIGAGLLRGTRLETVARIERELAARRV